MNTTTRAITAGLLSLAAMTAAVVSTSTAQESADVALCITCWSVGDPGR